MMKMIEGRAKCQSGGELRQLLDNNVYHDWILEIGDHVMTAP